MVAVPSRPLVKAVDCHLPTTQESTFDAPDPDRAAPDPAGEAPRGAAEAPDPAGEGSGAPPATADGVGGALAPPPPKGPAETEMGAHESGTARAFNTLFNRNHPP